MRKSSAELTFQSFEYWMSRYINFLNKLMAARRVVATELEKKEVLEAFVFKIVAAWEVFAEDLMVDCLNRDSSQYGEYMQLPRLAKHLPRSVCRAMLTGLGYTDFKSISNLKKTAKNVLTPSNNPYKAIPHSDGEVIDEFTKMRNFLAHYSTVAKRSLLNSYKRNHKLKNFREPADFLYANNARTGLMRLNDYVAAYASATSAMRGELGL